MHTYFKNQGRQILDARNENGNQVKRAAEANISLWS